MTSVPTKRFKLDPPESESPDIQNTLINNITALDQTKKAHENAYKVYQEYILTNITRKRGLFYHSSTASLLILIIFTAITVLYIVYGNTTNPIIQNSIWICIIILICIGSIFIGLNTTIFKDADKQEDLLIVYIGLMLITIFGAFAMVKFYPYTDKQYVINYFYAVPAFICGIVLSYPMHKNNLYGFFQERYVSRNTSLYLVASIILLLLFSISFITFQYYSNVFDSNSNNAAYTVMIVIMTVLGVCAALSFIAWAFFSSGEKFN